MLSSVVLAGELVSILLHLIRLLPCFLNTEWVVDDDEALSYFRK